MSLAKWARSKTRGEAKEKLHELPISETARGKAVPFPFADKSAYKAKFSNQEINQAIASAPKKRVSLTGLHAIQHSVREERVADYIDHPDEIPEGQRHPEHRGPIDVPVVIQYDGERYIHDGHHRSTAAKLSGEKDIVARFVDLDSVIKT